MKIDIDVKELKEVVRLLTPQVTVINNDVQQAVAPAPLHSLPTLNEVQTSESDYFATVAKLSEASVKDQGAALAVAVDNGFEYEKPNGGNGKEHQTIADRIEAAKAIIPGN